MPKKLVLPKKSAFVLINIALINRLKGSYKMLCYLVLQTRHKIILKSSLCPVTMLGIVACDRSYKQFLPNKILEKTQVGNCEGRRSELVL